MMDSVCFNGKLSESNVTFGQDVSDCLDNYPIFAIWNSTVGAKTIMGLTPTCHGIENCQPFVLEMYEQRKIAKPIVSFNLVEVVNSTPSIELGSYN